MLPSGVKILFNLDFSVILTKWYNLGIWWNVGYLLASVLTSNHIGDTEVDLANTDLKYYIWTNDENFLSVIQQY